MNIKEKGKASSKAKKQTSVKDDIFEALRNNAMVGTAQRVVTSAVQVLEEEIAAGILAAKKIEKKVIDVEEIRGEPNDLMNRIRRDTHEAVDLFLDAIAALSKQITTLTAASEKDKPPAEAAQRADVQESVPSALPLLSAEKALLPGESTTIFFTISDEKAVAAQRIRFKKTNLLGAGTAKILASSIKLEPAEVALAVGEEQEVAIQITVPKNALAGKYTALLLAQDNASVQVAISLEVVKPSDYV